MYTEPSLEVRMSGGMPSRDALDSGLKYHEVKLEPLFSQTQLGSLPKYWLLST